MITDCQIFMISEWFNNNKMKSNLKSDIQVLFLNSFIHFFYSFFDSFMKISFPNLLKCNKKIFILKIHIYSTLF